MNDPRTPGFEERGHLALSTAGDDASNRRGCNGEQKRVRIPGNRRILRVREIVAIVHGHVLQIACADRRGCSRSRRDLVALRNLDQD